jgi:5-methyltetrahydrofolate--homocysteine methyltransferase
MGEVAQRIVATMVALDKTKTLELTKEALEQGENPRQVLENGLLRGLLTVGDKWEKKEYFITEVLQATQIMKEAASLVEPHLLNDNAPNNGTVVIGTVEGDIHDIGKNLVSTMLKAGNFKVVDLGVNVPPDKFIEIAQAEQADIVACSLIMSVCIPKMQEVISKIRQAGLKAKSMIGGPPITEKVYERLGADGWAPDAPMAAKVAKQLVGVN